MISNRMNTFILEAQFYIFPEQRRYEQNIYSSETCTDPGYIHLGYLRITFASKTEIPQWIRTHCEYISGLRFVTREYECEALDILPNYMENIKKRIGRHVSIDCLDSIPNHLGVTEYMFEVQERMSEDNGEFKHQCYLRDLCSSRDEAIEICKAVDTGPSIRLVVREYHGEMLSNMQSCR